LSVNVDFCPKCKKAGLRYQRFEINTILFMEPQPHYDYEHPDSPELKENEEHRLKCEKWCPRCQEWIIPRGREVMYRGGF
jgi:Zn-finger nucleic acid-binding protein